MYLQHFGLRELPFSLTPDTGFFFKSASYQEALNTLLVSARNGEGFIKITGEVGNGKTLLCRSFLAALNRDKRPTNAIGTQDHSQPAAETSRFVTAYIPNPYLEPRSLLLALADEFRVPLDKAADQHLLLKGLTHALLDCARKGQRALVCLDEAQAMPPESLEMLRLLTNLETEKRKLLQVVLFGQPELDERLREHSVRQLRQRIVFQYELRGLARQELGDYLNHRLAVARYAGEPLFSPAAVTKLYRTSRGTPRLVNILAHKALMLAYGEGGRRVSARHIGIAAADTPEARRDWLPWVLGLGTVVMMVLLAGAWMLLR